MSDEFSRIQRLTRILQTSSAHVRIGIGDDAAVLRALHADLVLSVDSSVEHVHFTRQLATLREIGARAFVAALSDLAAMGAQPTAALCALCLPAELTDAELDELASGIAQAAQRYACPVVGGNLSAAQELSITTTVVGELDGPALTRAGAKPGDAIFVTGSLGGASLGLLLLQAGRAADAPTCVQRWRAPSARIETGRALRTLASAAIDVSDGALQDLAHLCRASNVGAVIDASAVPIEPELRAQAATLGRDPLELALCGGEDYELLYTAAPSAEAAAHGSMIGRITGEAGNVVVQDADGAPITLARHGYRHFRG